MSTTALLWIDLCAGLGGASQPALERGWRVVRVDIDPRFKPDVVADVQALPFKRVAPDVLWASPPCQDFTKWQQPASWFFPNHGRKAVRREPTTTLVEACLEAVEYFRPRFWILENVWAARKFVSPLAGPVRALVDGHAFWGWLPGLIPQTRAHKWMLPPGPERASRRARIPYEIGEAICVAVERAAA